MAQPFAKANRRNAAAAIFSQSGWRGGMKRRGKVVILVKTTDGARMGRVFKTVLGLAVALVVFLVGYGYLVDLTPAQHPVTQPVVLNAS